MCTKQYEALVVELSKLPYLKIRILDWEVIMSELVSIIITTCHGTNKLIRAIESVLNQTYRAREIIVVDDNGKDTQGQTDTKKMIHKYIESKKIKYIVHDVNRNGAVARNTGVRNANGKYIAFLDDDDFFFSSRLQECVRAAEVHQADLVYSDVLFVREDNMVGTMTAKPNGFSYKDLLMDQSLLGTGSNIFIRKNIYDSVNGFDEKFFRYQDVEFMIRALQKGKIIGINHLLVAKDITNARFYPQYSRFIQAQEMLLTKFRTEMNNLSRIEMRNALYTKRQELYYSACMSRNNKDMRNAFELLQSDILDMSVVEVVKVKLKGFYLGHIYNSVGFIRKMKQVKTNKKMTRNSTVFFLNNLNYLLSIAK